MKSYSNTRKSPSSASAGRASNGSLRLDLTGQLHHTLRRVSPGFRFHLITADPDDDKFADCAIAAEADYLITEDRHFDVLKTAGYKPQPITPEEFIRRHLGGA